MKNIVFCKTCLTSSGRPRVEFNNDGICNACIHSKAKSETNWQERGLQFKALIEELKRKAKGPYHCVVPWSGGKDSSTVAYKLKFEHGLNPLLATYSPMMPTEVGEINKRSFVDAGFDSISITPNLRVLKNLAKRFFIERGNPKVAWDAGINAFPMNLASDLGIQAVFYAEHGESEYGGRVLSEEHQMKRDFTEVLENYVGDDPLNWETEEVSIADLAPYIYPSPEKLASSPVTSYYFGYFFPWSVKENYEFIKTKVAFKCHPNGRTPGTFTDYDSLDDKIDGLYYYMQFIKFGFGRASRDASRLIHNGQLSRDEGLKLAGKFEDEFPSEHFNEVLDFLDLDFAEFTEVVDSHRNPEIWAKEGQHWTLKFPLV